MNKYMDLALKEAYTGIQNKYGGPFGAVVVNKDGIIIGSGCNRVLVDKDPTAHAEVVAIRNACNKIGSYDLSECTLYTSCEPCPMCLSAIIWSNIKNVYYGCTKDDASNIGFRDSDIYEFIKGNNEMLKLNEINHDECLEVFKKYEGTIY